MLQTIREHTQGWIAGTIISLIILTFALWGIHSYFVGGQNETVATVNGTEIKRQELAAAYERLKRQVAAQTQIQSNLNNDSLIRSRALQGLIEITALKQAALDQGFFVSMDQVYNYLQALPDFQIDGRFSQERFNQVLNSALLSPNQFLDLVQASLLIDQPKLGIVFSSFPLPQEIDTAIALVNQEREIAYAMISTQAFLQQLKPITEAEIGAYYQKNKASFLRPAMVSLDYVVLSEGYLKNAQKPDAETLRKYYLENQSSFVRPAKWQLAAVEVPFGDQPTNQSIAAAEQKADDLYHQLSKKDAIKNVNRFKAFKENQLLGLSDLPKDYEIPVAKLKQGEMTKPIKRKNGFIILKAVKVVPPTPLTFEEALPKVEEAYIQAKTEERFADMREQLADLAYEHPDSLQEAADRLGLRIQTTALFSKAAGNSNDVSQYQKVREAAFGNEVFTMKNNSDVIQIAPDTALVVRINQSKPEALLPLQVVKEEIVNKLKAQAAVEMAEKNAAQMLKQLQEEKMDFKALAQQQSLEFHDAGFVGRYAEKINPTILDHAFRMPVLKSKTSYAITKLPKGGYALIALKATRAGKIDDKERQAFAEQIQNANGILEYELYKKSVVENSKINVT